MPPPKRRFGLREALVDAQRLRLGRCEGSSFLKPTQHFQSLGALFRNGEMPDGAPPGSELRAPAPVGKNSISPTFLALIPLTIRLGTFRQRKCALRLLQVYRPPRIEDPAGEPVELVALKTHWRVIEKARGVGRSVIAHDTEK